SRTTSTCGSGTSHTAAAARPSENASSAVRKSPANPRTPSVPNSRLVPGATAMAGLTLRELRPLARLLQACLLALLDARVARQQLAALELGAQCGIRFDQGLRDPVAQRIGLA